MVKLYCFFQLDLIEANNQIPVGVGDVPKMAIVTFQSVWIY